MTQRDESSDADAQEVLEALAAVVEDPRFMEKLIAHAATLLRGYPDMGLAVPTGLDAARALVMDAISDTTKAALGESGRGTRTWRPRDAPLLRHLKTVVSNRVRVLKKRAEKFLGRLPEVEGEQGRVVPEVVAETDVEAALAGRELAEKRVEGLMALAEERGYEDAYYVLVAIKDGVRGSTNLMVEAGLSSLGKVHRAKAKIRELLAEIPAELRGDDESGE